MRVLYLTPYVPSPVRVRPYQLIRHLAELGHDVTLICLAGAGEEPRALEELRRRCAEVVTVPTSSARALLQVLRGLPGDQPLQAAFGASNELVGQALRRADQHDVIHVEHLRGSSYGPPLRQYPLMFDAVDCISLLFERAYRQSPSLAGRARALLDLPRTRRAEGALGATFPHIVVTSDEDRWALAQLQAPARQSPSIDVLPNGVDMGAFTPGDPAGRDPATLVFTGKMSYHANEAAALYLAQHILPLIWRRRPDVRCQVVGRGPTAAVRALGADPRIVVTGEVPAVVPFLQRATLAVVPLRYGVGIQNKVLEAMATATPVVASPQAARALRAQSGDELLLAATPQAFADAVLDLLDAPERRRLLGERGRRYVEQHHSWHQIAARLAQLYELVQGSTFNVQR